MHIQVDDVLNDVHLYLPYFNEETVKDVVEALQSTEGGDIPTDIYGESLSGKRFETLTVKPKKKMQMSIPGQMTLEVFANQGTEAPALVSITDTQGAPTPVQQQTQIPDVAEVTPAQPTNAFQQMHAIAHRPFRRMLNRQQMLSRAQLLHRKTMAPDSQQEEVEDLFDREAVMKFINDAGLLSYNVRALRINDYLKSLYRMAHLLSMSKLHREAIREVQNEIVQIIRDYVEDLKAAGKYDDLVQQIKQFKLATQIFDAFGETVDNYSVHDMFTTTDTDIERQFQIAV